MKGANQRYSTPKELLVSQARNGLGSGKERLRGTGPQSTDHLRGNGLQLSSQERRTRRDFIILRRPVIRGAALDYIGNVDFLTYETQGLDHLVEKFSCSADKRPPLLVLIKPGTFPNEHQPGLR